MVESRRSTKVNSGHKGQQEEQRGPHSQRGQWHDDGQRKSMEVNKSQRKSMKVN